MSCFLGFSVRLFSVINFESVIHEFDPWFNYRSTLKLVSNGFYSFLNWFDEKAWYPLGRIVGGTIYPGLMLTSGLIHEILNFFSFPANIRDISVLMGPIFSCFTVLVSFLLTREIWNTNSGLICGSLMSIVPGYMSRSVSGSYDNESVAIFAMLLTFFLWLKSVKTGHVSWAILCSIAYFYMVSAWGGYVFIINLISLHVITLVVFQRHSHRLYVAFSVFYIFGLVFSMQIPFVGFQSVKTSEHMSAAFAFMILQVYTFYKSFSNKIKNIDIWQSFYVVSTICVVGLLTYIYLTKIGVLYPWSGRFYSLWDTSYAAVNIPIITSVSEHQPPPWTSTFYDLTILMCFYPAGIWLCFHYMNDERIFPILYAITATYFSGIMSRLILTLAPIVCISSSITISNLLQTYVEYTCDEPDETNLLYESAENIDIDCAGDRYYDGVSGDYLNFLNKDDNKNGNSDSFSRTNKFKKNKMVFNFVNGMICGVCLLFFAKHALQAARYSYSSPSIVMATSDSHGNRVIIDDFREAYYWLRYNTHEDDRIMSWWDYGYQITGLANRTTIVDNNTWNNSHIALVGKAMSSTESAAYEISKKLDVDYVLVVFGGMIGFSGDDINKFLWMVRISEGEHPQDIYEYDYFTNNGEYRVDRMATETMLNSLMYRLSYYNFGQVINNHYGIGGLDLARNTEIGLKNFKLKYFQEAFTSENWIMRIFKRLPMANRIPLDYARKKNNKYFTNKSFRKMKGFLKNHKLIIKGIKKKYYSFMS